MNNTPLRLGSGVSTAAKAFERLELAVLSPLVCLGTFAISDSAGDEARLRDCGIMEAHAGEDRLSVQHILIE